jgi:hypothetical protein
MTKFKRTASEPYTLITPLSSLADLEEFLKHNIFALGLFSACSRLRGADVYVPRQ